MAEISLYLIAGRTSADARVHHQPKEGFRQKRLGGSTVTKCGRYAHWSVRFPRRAVGDGKCKVCAKHG